MISVLSGYAIKYNGGPYADIICKHGQTIEVINFWDYAKGEANAPMDEFGLEIELMSWTEESKEWIHNYCEGH